jgi:UPF0755 protein
MRFLGRLVVWLLAATLLVGAGWTYLAVDTALPGPLAQAKTVVLPRGAGIAAIAEALAAEGVVRRAWEFELAALVSGRARALKAGEYAFQQSISLADTLALLESGRTVVHRFTLAEGLTTAQCLALLGQADALDGTVPERVPEGVLLPETYHYSRGDSRARMVERMRAAMSETLAELWAKRARDQPLATPMQALALASIVEKETALASERPLVAEVFLNRLKRGMRLQSDPTVIYAISGGAGDLGRPLSRADLRVQSPYNTYVADGLPPGPIANPGRASIEATLNPAAGEDLYFVADGSGGHVFARTLEEHNRNVQRWRQILSERGQPLPKE